MQVVFLGPKQIRQMILLIISAILVAGIFIHWNQIARRFFGVKPGVRFEGRLVQGLLPDEVTKLVKAMADKIDRTPLNACYYPETGQIIPSQAGRSVNIAETVHQVCTAPPGADLKLAVAIIAPKIPEDYFRAVYRGDKTLPRVAFAINVAWGEEFLPEMLNILAEEKVKATFFFVGNWVKMFPEQVKAIAAAGHEIANHGLYHGHPGQMSREELQRLIVENEQLLTSLSGKKSTQLFAPPYGELNTQVISTAGELGFRTIMWTVDSIDWKNPEPGVLSQRVLSKAENGAIILFHPTAPTKTALRNIIRSLRKQGLEPGTVSWVLGKG